MQLNLDSIEDELLRQKASFFKKRLLQWYRLQNRILPWRQDWQTIGDPYRIWVSEIMLQQTVIKAVIPAYHRFMSTFPNIEDLAKANEEDVRRASRGLGYYRRFKLLHQASQQLVNRQPKLQQFWPQSYKEWLELPGVGNYTAAAIASIAFGESVPVVDGNVERVFCRLLDLRIEPGQTKLKKLCFELGSLLIPADAPGDFNQALMELGQTVCTKQSPSCQQCPVQSVCLAYRRSSQSEAPQTKKRTAPESIHGILLIATYQGKLGLTKRPKKARFLRETLGFLTGYYGPDLSVSWDGYETPMKKTEMIAVGKFKHTIMNFRIDMDVYRFEPDRTQRKHFTWYDSEEIESLLVANFDRKAWQLLTRTEEQEQPRIERAKRATIREYGLQT